LKTKSRLIDLALLFLKLGSVGFGGPPALISMMEIEMVQKRHWVKRDFFMDMLAAINLVPGPNAVEMAIYLGYIRAGFPGLFIAGTCFLLPATLITLLIAHYYKTFGSLPQAQAILAGVTPTIIAIILTSGYRIGKSALKNPETIIIAIGCFIGALSGINGMIVILVAGVLGLIIYFVKKRNISPMMILFSPIIQAEKYLIFLNDRLTQLFLYFLKIGAILYGGGYVLFAYINYDIVNQYRWLSEKQLLDAIAVGQITPGPVSSAATFIGYLIEGLPGAILATIAIFLPSFFIVLLLGKILPQLRKSPIAQSFLDGVNSGVVALIIAVGLTLMRDSINDIGPAIIFIIGVFVLIRYKLDPALLILSGGLIGLINMFLKT
jgi:chromate transporter